MLSATLVNRILKAQLVATVDVTNARQERGSWYDIWAATVAIIGMCVRHYKMGTVNMLGTWTNCMGHTISRANQLEQVTMAELWSRWPNSHFNQRRCTP